MSNNNGLGINSFSGPMGEKEPAYGTAENMKILSKIGMQPTPSMNAAKQSQRKASSKSKGKGKSEPPPPPPQEIAGEQAPIANYDQQLVQFWTQLAAEPGASPLVQKLAQEAQAGGVH